MRFFRRAVSKAWLDHIRTLNQPGFVNLWSPHAGRRWREGRPGDIVLLVASPASARILAFGMIHSRVPDFASHAWLRFGPRNGVGSLREMREQIADYGPLSRHQDPMIANLILVNLVLFAEDMPLESKGRDLAWVMGRDLSFDDANDYLLSLRLSASRPKVFADRAQAHLRVHPSENLSQDDGVTLAEMNAWSAFGRRCAVTGWRVECALEVTFFHPPHQGGPPSVENTLLLKKDLSALQAQDLIAFNNEGKLLVSTSLAELDTQVYGELGKLSLRRTVLPRFTPDLESIRWRIDRFHRKQADPDWNGEG